MEEGGSGGWKQVMQCTGNTPMGCDGASMHALHIRKAISKGQVQAATTFRDI